MLFSNRIHCVDWNTLEGTAFDYLANHTMCGCAGFQFGRLPHKVLWLNDASSGDGAQEYAVYRIIEDRRDKNGDGEVLAEQIESITVSWCKPDKLRQYIEESQRFSTHPEAWKPIGKPEIRRIEGKNHRCNLCK